MRHRLTLWTICPLVLAMSWAVLRLWPVGIGAAGLWWLSLGILAWRRPAWLAVPPPGQPVPLGLLGVPWAVLSALAIQVSAWAVVAMIGDCAREPWYQSVIARSAAALRLQAQEPGCFLANAAALTTAMLDLALPAMMVKAVLDVLRRDQAAAGSRLMAAAALLMLAHVLMVLLVRRYLPEVPLTGSAVNQSRLRTWDLFLPFATVWVCVVAAAGMAMAALRLGRR